MELTIGKLDQLRGKGHPPGAVLDQSTERGWRGVFALDGGPVVDPGSRFPTFDANGKLTGEWADFARLKAEAEEEDRRMRGYRRGTGTD